MVPWGKVKEWAEYDRIRASAFEAMVLALEKGGIKDPSHFEAGRGISWRSKACLRIDFDVLGDGRVLYTVSRGRDEFRAGVSLQDFVSLVKRALATPDATLRQLADA